LSQLVPLTVAVPLLSAAFIGAFGRHLPPTVSQLLALGASAAVAAMSLVLLVHVGRHDLVYWFGGWHPRHGVALGVDFEVDPVGAAHASLVGVLATAAVLASWAFFRGAEVGPIYYTLMLVFVAGMTGFSLTGDLFNLFVWLELMSVAAYALVGYQVRQTAVLQGAVNFAVTNSVGSFSVLFGIAHHYGTTAALNFEQLGETLTGKPVDAVVVAALVLLMVGFLIKAGAVPFHFWLSDAYAVAPSPVGVLLAGIMSDLAFTAISRTWWDIFAPAAGPHVAVVRNLLIAVGIASALLGGVMCLIEADLKRMVAFVVISHGGIFLVGVALLTARGLAGSTAYVISDGLLKAALFLAIGAVIHRLGASDELVLHGRGRARRWLPLASVFVVCALGFAALPPFAPFVSKGLIEQAADSLGYGWVPPVLTLATLLTGAALLRATGRIFLGLGPDEDPMLRRQPGRGPAGEPTEQSHSRTARLSVLVPAVVLAIAGLAVSFAPQIAGQTENAAHRSIDYRAKEALVLHGVEPPAPKAPPHVSFGPARYAYAGASVAGAVLLAFGLLYRRRLPGPLRRALRPAGAVFPALRLVHSGAATDYVAYAVFGAAIFSVVWGIGFR
jgi:multicomponent Na+:H+ antiporter subunit D